MERTIGKIPLLAASISLGLMLGTAATKPALAGSFDSNIVDISNNQTIGHLKFAWDDANVTSNSLNNFSDLTDFNYTDASGKSFDLGFASGASFTSNFYYNLNTGKFNAIAYNTSATSSTRTGFYASSAKVAKDFSVMPADFVKTFTLFDLLPPPPSSSGSSTSPLPPSSSGSFTSPPPPSAAGSPAPSSSFGTAAPTAEAIPESSSVVGLLVIGGLGLGMSRRRSSK